MSELATNDRIRPVWPLLFAPLIAAAAVATTVAFHAFLASNVFLLLFTAVLVAALRGGLAAGIVATLGCTLGAALFLFPPVPSLEIAVGADVARLAIFTAIGLLISWLSHSLLAARRRADVRAALLRESERSYRSLFEHVNEALYVLDRDGVLWLVNEAAARLHGRSSDALVGRPLGELAAGLAAADALLAQIRRAADDGPQQLDWRGVGAAGEERELELTLARARYLGRDVVLVAGRDVTEARLLEARMRRTQKMEAVGRLAGGVAHDFNNVLTTIHASACLLREDLEAGDPRAEDVDAILHASEAAADITRQLLSFSRERQEQPRPSDVDAAVASMHGMLRRLVGPQVRLEVQVTGEGAWAMMEPGHVQQIVMNLVVNARDAVGDRGTIRIDVRPEAGEQGGSVALSVADDGTGMDEATIAHIFEPFFTTKAEGKGTGLGLATVYGIVGRAGGSIDVESAPGRGSVFRVALPAVAPPDEARGAASGRGALQPRHYRQGSRRDYIPRAEGE